jgi:hypothetical protein
MASTRASKNKAKYEYLSEDSKELERIYKLHNPDTESEGESCLGIELDFKNLRDEFIALKDDCTRLESERDAAVASTREAVKKLSKLEKKVDQEKMDETRLKVVEREIVASGKAIDAATKEQVLQDGKIVLEKLKLEQKNVEFNAKKVDGDAKALAVQGKIAADLVKAADKESSNLEKAEKLAFDKKSEEEKAERKKTEANEKDEANIREMEQKLEFQGYA